MSVLPVGFGASGYDVGDIGHSLRFRGSASAYISKTISTSTTSTYFAAVKRGRLGVVSPIFDTNIKFNANDTLTAFGLTTTAVFRDPTAWLFIHVSNGGLYINGVSYGAVTTSALTNPRIGYDGTNYFDGHIARIGCVDGSSSSYTNFGYLNTDTNAWVTKSQSAVKAVVDAGGTNSFMLDFDDATSLTTLGYDKSSKGNNWTLNNFSLTAGTTYDWMLDTPSNNFCTLNPIGSYNSTISQANLNATGSGTQRALSTVWLSSGKWYFEYQPSTIGTVCGVGVIKDTASLSSGSVGASEYFYRTNGQTGNNGGYASYGASYTTSDIIGVALDLDAGTLVFYKNNSSQGTAFSSLSGTFALQHVGFVDTNAGYINFGQRPFTYTPPTGFKSLCTANLSDPAIPNPLNHFDVVTRTGTAATYSVTGRRFQPDLVWVKSRGRAVDHALYDSVRGVQKQLESNQTGAETTEATGITAFNSDGYTGGALDQINGTTATNSFVDWLWKAGGTAVTNTSGTITSQVSANTTAGFSIVTYTGNGVNGSTVGHGLGKTPSLIIEKDRSAGSFNWSVQGCGKIWTPATSGLFLNTTNALNPGQITTPTNSSTVFTPADTAYANVNGNLNVAICFAEILGFSKIGSYTGNGSADGPFVWCGFRPRWVLIKRIDTTGNWYLLDTTRSGGNVVDEALYPDLPNLESVNEPAVAVDCTSGGFKSRNTNVGMNANGGTYIFYAIADVAGKFSNSR